MDSFQCSLLFTQTMWATELGDKKIADKIESLIRNFDQSFPVHVSFYILTVHETSAPNISPAASYDSDSSEMKKSSRPSGSRRKTPRVHKESLIFAQTIIDYDVEDHQSDRLHFSFNRPSSFDSEINVIGEQELQKYRNQFNIPDTINLMLPGERAVWNPPQNAVAIYGSMLSCGITLPLQPFITRFLADAKLAPAQLAPNSYRILMCLCLIWKMKGYGPPSPHEIRHLYTLRQSGHGGTYFLFSSTVENWIPERVVNPGQVEISDDEKKKGFIWGLPTSNKRWKNSWFFVSGAWGRDASASVRHNLPARRVPRHFTSPDAWSKALPILSDDEVSHLAAAAVLPLAERGEPFLLDEAKMIKEGLFPRLHARLKRLNEFDVVCDLLARAIKNSAAASQRQATALAKEGIAPLNGDDSADSEGGGACPDQHVDPDNQGDREVAARPTPSLKGKEKVRGLRANEDVPIFDANVPETLEDPASDLNPRVGRGKRPAEHASDHVARPTKRASRVVQYVISSDEDGDGDGDGEPELARNALTEEINSGTPTVKHRVTDSSTHSENAIPPQPSFAPHIFDSAPHPSDSTPYFPDSTHASSVPHTSSAPLGQPVHSASAVERDGTARTDFPRPATPTVNPKDTHEVPPAASTKASEASGSASLTDFSATEILAHLVQNDVYVGPGWEHVKNKSCNRKMEFFFNCHSLMMFEMADNYRHGNVVSAENRHLREQISRAVADKFNVEESCSRQLAQLKESTDKYLAAQLAVEEKLSVAEEEIKLLKEQLSTSQDSLAAHMEVKRLAEEAREKAERESEDLRNQQVSREAILEDMKAELEAQAVDRFKRSPAYDALLLREFERGMRQSKKFFAMKDHSNEKSLKRFDKSLKLHMDSAVGSIKDQIKRWKAHCRYNRTDPLPMHLEIPTNRAFNTYYSGRKGSLSSTGDEPDLGPVSGRDYGPFTPTEDEEIVWPSEDEIGDEDSEEVPLTDA